MTKKMKIMTYNKWTMWPGKWWSLPVAKGLWLARWKSQLKNEPGTWRS
jgi:hypothetical protein